MPDLCHRPAPAVETTGAGALSWLAAGPCSWFGQLLLRTTVTASETTAEEFWFLCLRRALASWKSALLFTPETIQMPM